MANLITNSQQQQFRDTMVRKIKQYFNQPIDKWTIEETEVIFSLIDLTGSLMSLSAGSHIVMNQTKQYGIVLGYTNMLPKLEDFKKIEIHQIENLHSIPYFKAEEQLRAIVLLKGPEHSIIISDIQNLTPDYPERYHPCSILDSQMISVMLDILQI